MFPNVTQYVKDEGGKLRLEDVFLHYRGKFTDVEVQNRIDWAKEEGKLKQEGNYLVDPFR